MRLWIRLASFVVVVTFLIALSIAVPQTPGSESFLGQTSVGRTSVEQPSARTILLAQGDGKGKDGKGDGKGDSDSDKDKGSGNDNDKDKSCPTKPCGPKK